MSQLLTDHRRQSPVTVGQCRVTKADVSAQDATDECSDKISQAREAVRRHIQRRCDTRRVERRVEVELSHGNMSAGGQQQRLEESHC